MRKFYQEPVLGILYFTSDVIAASTLYSKKDDDNLVELINDVDPYNASGANS